MKVRCEWATNGSQADVQYHDTEWGVPISIVFTDYASYAKLEQGYYRRWCYRYPAVCCYVSEISMILTEEAEGSCLFSLQYLFTLE
ncbi:MAG: hypothetical protein JO297_08205 [Nitrososphaeraceae archaeon]|nr:hypothetical protein [Nitrososphaeraceae archaeon]